MDSYLTLKLIHILSATVIAGTGIGIAFFMVLTYLSKSPAALLVTCKSVIIGDWIFTTPAIIVQLVSGFLLMHKLNYSFSSTWFYTVIALFLAMGACWLPVVRIQYVLKNLIERGAKNDTIPPSFHKLFKIWFALGIPAFAMIIAIFYMMVFKPFL